MRSSLLRVGALLAGLLVVVVAVVVRQLAITATPSVTPGSPTAGAVAPSTAGPDAVIPWIDALPTPQPSPAERIVPPGTRSCGPADVRATAYWGGATGSMAGGIAVVNVSSSPCTLTGSPKAVHVLAGTKTLRVGYLGLDLVGPEGFAHAGPALLAPGERADASLFWTNWCADMVVVPTSLLVTMPDGSGTIVALPDAGSPGPGIGSTPRCDTPGQGSTLSAMAFRYRAPEAPEVEPQPASATISGLPGEVTAGHEVAFQVTLTNLGDEPALLDPCPSYTEDIAIDGRALKPPGMRTYLLDCAAIGPSIPAHVSVILEMRYPVPADVQPGEAELGWSMDPGGPLDSLGTSVHAPVMIDPP